MLYKIYRYRISNYPANSKRRILVWVLFSEPQRGLAKNKRNKNELKQIGNWTQNSSIFFFFQKTHVLARKNSFFWERQPCLTKTTPILENNDEIKIFSVDFCFNVHLQIVGHKKWVLIKWFYLHIRNMNGKISLAIGAMNIAPGLQIHAPQNSRAFQMLLGERSFLQLLDSRWKKLYNKSCHLVLTFYSHSFPNSKLNG